MASPIAEVRRNLLLSHWIGGVSVWKADDAAETIIIVCKAPQYDADDNSVFAYNFRTNALTYLGTTALGKDGIAAVVVLNDGTVLLFVPETPAAGQSGSLADLYVVQMAFRLGGEPVAVGSSGVDSYARSLIANINARLANAKAQL